MCTQKGLSMLDVMDIQKILPHRYPFLLVDRVVHVEPGQYVEAYKNISISEQIFQGHFPGHPIYPGVMIVEGMAGHCYSWGRQRRWKLICRIEHAASIRQRKINSP